MIIIEGPDNTGKTTLMNQLITDLDLIKAPLKFDPHGKEDVEKEVVEFYDGVIAHLSNKEPEELLREVWDRVYFSELVYGPLKRGKVGFSDIQRQKVPELLSFHKPLVIWCMTSKDKILSNLKDRKQYISPEEVNEVIYNYGKLYHGLNKITPYYYRYDYTYNSYENLRRYVSLYLIAMGGFK